MYVKYKLVMYNLFIVIIVMDIGFLGIIFKIVNIYVIYSKL